MYKATKGEVIEPHPFSYTLFMDKNNVFLQRFSSAQPINETNAYAS